MAQRHVITLIIDREVMVISPIIRNTYTNHAGFVIREIGGENNGRVLLADLDALRDGYRRQIFGHLQVRNYAPVPYLVGTTLIVSGSLEKIIVPGQPAVQYLIVTELTLTRGGGLYGLYPRVEAHNSQDVLQHFQINAPGVLAIPAAAPPDNN
ncbi:hypothetical protein BGW38_007312 [Lunasporangiospora selenospora]|uniref:Uncharacterized protein n=1 Tax=Lunasporangiospora selenospora TaxID=979761 RepID=A0A9P6K9S0_9FUNG|nr:hypothetical protein BGW38_007312 [Lunasporangiospora selenospora]